MLNNVELKKKKKDHNNGAWQLRPTTLPRLCYSLLYPGTQTKQRSWLIIANKMIN